MRLSMTDDGTGRVYIDNYVKIQEILVREGMDSCNPVTVPITKELMQRIYDGDREPLNEELTKWFRTITGDIG